MHFKIKIFLFTLISCCYLNTVFEFFDNEEKLNFANETHAYIYQTTFKVNITETKVQKELDEIEFIQQSKGVFFPLVIAESSLHYILQFSQPPEKKYILYSSLLI